MVWIQTRTDVLSVLIWVQHVCKGYQQMTKNFSSKRRDKKWNGMTAAFCKPTFISNTELIFSQAKFLSVKLYLFFLLINFTIFFVCSKEKSHLDSSFEYPQHMFWSRNKKNIFQLHSLTWRPAE